MLDEEWSQYKQLRGLTERMMSAHPLNFRTRVYETISYDEPWLHFHVFFSEILKSSNKLHSIRRHGGDRTPIVSERRLLFDVADDSSRRVASQTVGRRLGTRVKIPRKDVTSYDCSGSSRSGPSANFLSLVPPCLPFREQQST